MINDKVNKKAAENFLGSMDMTMREGDHVRNARMDAISYGWNSSTLYFILDAIEDAYVKKSCKEA